jgi:hypothetical protein
LFLLVMIPLIINYVSCVIFVKFKFNTNFGSCYFNHNPFLLHFFSYEFWNWIIWEFLNCTHTSMFDGHNTNTWVTP